MKGGVSHSRRCFVQQRQISETNEAGEGGSPDNGSLGKATTGYLPRVEKLDSARSLVVASPCAKSMYVEQEYGTAAPHHHGSALRELRLFAPRRFLLWMTPQLEHEIFKMSKI